MAEIQRWRTHACTHDVQMPASARREGSLSSFFLRPIDLKGYLFAITGSATFSAAQTFAEHRPGALRNRKRSCSAGSSVTSYSSLNPVVIGNLAARRLGSSPPMNPRASA